MIAILCGSSWRQKTSQTPLEASVRLVSVIQRGLEKSLSGSDKYKFVHVEAIPKFDREAVSVEIPVKGIRSLHSFSRLDGGILASQLSCLECTVAAKCPSCCLAKLAVSSEEVEAAVVRKCLLGDDSEEELEAHFEESDAESEDDAASEAPEENSGSTSDEEENSLSDPCSVVWVLWGRRRYPAKVVHLPGLPPDVRAGLRRDYEKSAVVQFYGDLDFSRVAVNKVTELGQSNKDLRWSRFPGIMEKYNLALAHIRFKSG